MPDITDLLCSCTGLHFDWVVITDSLSLSYNRGPGTTNCLRSGDDLMERDDSQLRLALQRHHPESYGWAMCCCRRDAAQAEEVLQIAYLKVLEGKARFDGRSAFKTWLFAVVRRTAADQRRRAMLRRVLPWHWRTRVIADAPADAALDLAELHAIFQRSLADHRLVHLDFGGCKSSVIFAWGGEAAEVVCRRFGKVIDPFSAAPLWLSGTHRHRPWWG